MRRIVAAAATLALLAVVPAAGAAATPEPYQHNDGRGFRDVLPPGTNGRDNALELGRFQADKTTRPRHNNDQLGMYANLVHGAPGITAAELPRYFKDSSFGVPPGQTERTYTPANCGDVTVVRDKQFGVPHIYSPSRASALCATGYVTGEDRMFFIDVLRHLGRAQLASFAGGAPGNRAFDQMEWQVAPYTEDDLQRQFDQGDNLYGAEGKALQEDVTNYVRGINEFIDEANLDPTKLPGEYPLIEKTLEPWKVTDIIATAALVGGIFGKGGGQDLSWGELLRDFQKRFGRARGTELWRDFLSPNDPEAPTTIHNGKRFPYGLTPRRLARNSLALPDPGSVADSRVVESGTDAKASSVRRGATPGSVTGLIALPHSNSNALVVSGRESKSGHPLAVFGPQVGYFAPQILMEQDVHAPGIDARGAAFPGVNLYVELGRGRDYAWSATSAGQDIIDSFALPLCEAGGGKATKQSTSYVYRGKCQPMEILKRTNSWTPTAADMTPPGMQTLRAERTKLGIVVGRGTTRGKPVAYTELRSTYLHEVDSARGFSDYNNPDKMKNPRDFQRASAKIGYTFNWFYVDNKHIAYFNSGNNPVRRRGVDPQLPIAASFEWKGFNPSNNTAAYTAFSTHPQVIDQDYLTSWNNKQAPDFAGTPKNIFSSIYRSQPLDDRVRAGIRGAKKLDLPGLVNAMGGAGTVDLRGDKVLPWALKVLGAQRDPKLGKAIAKLAAWQRSGSHRIDRNRDRVYESKDAIQIMDAWWPKLLEAQFGPTLGKPLMESLERRVAFDNEPNNHGDHLGSAYQTGWYGYAQKDLRAVLHRRVRGRFHRIFCGGGKLARCRAALASSLRAALTVDPKQLYADETCAADGHPGDQYCFDEIRLRPLGGITQPLIPWINRPTYQQADEIQSHR